MDTGKQREGRGWDGERLDLDAYLARIGYRGDRSPTIATLRALHFAHVTSIPFENLEIVLGRGLPLDLEPLQDKLVRRSRGGYCFEHARLFSAAAERLGFGVTGLLSRVSMGSGKLRPATHAVPLVTTADTGERWLCDVGFGSSPLQPIEFADGTVTSHGGWTHRLALDGGPASGRSSGPRATGGRTCTTSRSTRPTPSTTWWETTTCPRTRTRLSSGGWCCSGWSRECCTCSTRPC